MRPDTNAHAIRCEQPFFPLGEQLLSAFGALLFGYIVGELALDQLADPVQWFAGVLLTALVYAALLFGYRLRRLRQRVR